MDSKVWEGSTPDFGEMARWKAMSQSRVTANQIVFHNSNLTAKTDFETADTRGQNVMGEVTCRSLDELVVL
jgi:hypothetical protein